MSELGGFESAAPREDQSVSPEQATEAAKQRFAGTSQALQQIQREEKKSRKRDDGVAQAILQFLSDEQRTHLATLISRLAALNCPSPFILAVLSLLSEQCRKAVHDYLKDSMQATDEQISSAEHALSVSGLDAAGTRDLGEWVLRMEMVLSSNPHQILSALLLPDEQNIDGTVLQLATFVLQDFFKEQQKPMPFEALQPIAVNILQSVFTPHMHARMRAKLSQQKEAEEE
jgi:hypothetical protein